MTSTSTLTKQVTRLANGVEVENSGMSLEGRRKQLVEDALNIYSGKASQEIFHRSWRHDSMFEDPFSKCYGYKQYAGQFYGIPKVFSQSRTFMYRVISSSESPNRIVYEQRQEYTFRLISTKAAIQSIIFLDLDENDKIVKLEDKWNGKDQPVRFGALWLRRLNSVTVPWLIGVPKYETQ